MKGADEKKKRMEEFGFLFIHAFIDQHLVTVKFGYYSQCFLSKIYQINDLYAKNHMFYMTKCHFCLFKKFSKKIKSESKFIWLR